jgi:Arylsulfotransferase (ASST)
VGWGHGHGIIMDKHYRIVKSVEAGSYQAASDMHEFMLLPDGKSALLTQYLRSAADLCQWDICNGLGYIQEGAFQEVDVETGKVLFEWKSLDHIDTAESYVPPDTTEISGNGRDIGLPWDYFHINSVDKNAAGDYLISARHTSGIYKISGKDGHVIWRLNGAKSDFQLKDFDTEYGFSFQHDARFIHESRTTTTISLFDNGSNGYNFTQDISTGVVVILDHEKMTATRLRNYSSPPLEDGLQHMSKSQGNTQLLPNGNVVVGWGNNAYWSEYLEDGTPVWYGSIGLTNVMNYRAHKFNWTGLPLTRPALWTYSKSGTHEEGLMVYVSWNGATEVRQWSIFTASSAKGPWHLQATIPKNGFETIWHHDGFAQYSYAAALDKDGSILSKSEAQETFVPSVELRPNCDELACFSSVLDEEEEERERKKMEAEEAAAETERIRVEEEDAARLPEEEAQHKRKVALIWGVISLWFALGLVVARRVVMRALVACTYFAYDVGAFAHRRAKSGKRRYNLISGNERAGADTPDSGISLEPS